MEPFVAIEVLVGVQLIGRKSRDDAVGAEYDATTSTKKLWKDEWEQEND